jgi:hypothetical protein
MPNFLFWNTAKSDIADLIATLAVVEEVDVLILAELAANPFSLLLKLNEVSSPQFRYAPGLCQSLHFFTRFDEEFLSPLSESDRYSIRSLKLPAREEILLAGAHLPSQLRYKPTDITVMCQRLARAISEHENDRGHSRTVLLGDLNLNPFDEGVMMASGLHASMSRKVAEKFERTVQGEAYRFFYNPMWSHMNDRCSATAGTYYYANSTHSNFFWNTFDQVLLRPSLLAGFAHEGLSIPKQIGEVALVDGSGIPRKSISDHLPVKLSLDF